MQKIVMFSFQSFDFYVIQKYYLIELRAFGKINEHYVPTVTLRWDTIGAFFCVRYCCRIMLLAIKGKIAIFD